MKLFWVVALAVSIAACKKEEVGEHVTLRAKCHYCAVEWVHNGVTVSDTIKYHVINGNDTILGTSAHHFYNFRTSDRASVSVCSLDTIFTTIYPDTDSTTTDTSFHEVAAWVIVNNAVLNASAPHGACASASYH
jgi:hypothetical protein